MSSTFKLELTPEKKKIIRGDSVENDQNHGETQNH